MSLFPERFKQAILGSMFETEAEPEALHLAAANGQEAVVEVAVQ